MANVTPLVKRTVIKKRTNKFIRHQSDRFKRVGESWRRPKGIDSFTRRRFKGQRLMPNCGYGSNKTTRHLLPNGFKKFLVKNVQDLDILLMNNRIFCAEIAKNVSSLTRKTILERAAALNVRVTNGFAKMRTVEKK
eukprot:CAMPEP_0114989200 /NCGR_PEP_ID=MMETSP0216-20121206/10059_1 /TAXON_ID=223996 /ORGANISM="Protocruzia adherens, Strain Boccale" /LENGTH=135 /DNA_ID=CAMNT_0002352139 /DNA_START=44 /DNA_END=451 /DNA_ORIENTATION=+